MLETIDHYWGILFGIVIGSFLTAVGFGGAIYFLWRIRRSTESAMAEVYKLEEKDDDDGGKLHRACARFRWQDDVYEVASVWSRPVGYTDGERVVAHFPPGQPEQAMIGPWRNLMLFLSLGTFGTLVIAGFVVYAIYWPR